MILPANLGLSLLSSLSVFGVVVMAVAYVNRGKPEWQRDMRVIIVLAVGNVGEALVLWVACRA